MTLNKNGRFNASEVAAYIVQKFNEKGMYLDHLKLQKILYFITLDWVREYGEYPYKQATEMWKLGPVVRSVYSEYRTNGYSQIVEQPTTLIVNNDGMRFGKHEVANFDLPESALVDKVISKYGEMNSFDLVDITHDHSPWKRKEEDIRSGVSNIEYTFDDYQEAINELKW
ncbi:MULTISPECIES: Panacea domain-containing protein [Lysinibacillus]|uniref:DUF4065 domain-containing protein n=1 Tax=Lysinibacillus capsici TaxID=2115968 RepID=A0ABY8KL60_9BACI|nr:type II toxin-antitoxin system antitoxin SocA domain-containing protein [Lysinibacillus capsici]WGF40224.1 DUF4065 domain-containing protein [Lysinibacillus capsici]